MPPASYCQVEAKLAQSAAGLSAASIPTIAASPAPVVRPTPAPAPGPAPAPVPEPVAPAAEAPAPAPASELAASPAGDDSQPASDVAALAAEARQKLEVRAGPCCHYNFQVRFLVVCSLRLLVSGDRADVRVWHTISG